MVINLSATLESHFRVKLVLNNSLDPAAEVSSVSRDQSAGQQW